MLTVLELREANTDEHGEGKKGGKEARKQTRQGLVGPGKELRLYPDGIGKL